MKLKNIIKKPSSNQLVGGALFVLGIVQMVLSNRKEAGDRQVMKNELKSELFSDLVKEFSNDKN